MGVSPTLPVTSRLHWSLTVSGMQIAFPVAAVIFPANRIRIEEAST